jgi:hypothetical protein
MPTNSRRKGSREEVALVRYLQAHGFAAEKCSRTGYHGPDVSIPLLGRDRFAEVKCRSRGFRDIYNWLADNDLLVVRADRREPLVIVPLRLAAEVAAKAEGCQTTRGAPLPRQEDPPWPLVGQLPIGEA